MKEITINIAGTDFYLLYNGAAMYELRDKFGTENVFEVIKHNNYESFSALCDVLAVMIEQGELFRRWHGYDKGRIVTSATLRVLLRPVDIPEVHQAVMAAIMEGMRNETPEDEDIDLGLMCGLTVRETELMRVGEFVDLVNLKTKKREDDN